MKTTQYELSLEEFESNKMHKGFVITATIIMAIVLYYAATQFAYHLGMGLPALEFSSAAPDISILRK